MKGLSPRLTDDGSATIFFCQADISSLNASKTKKRYEITVATARVVGDVQLASLTERIESELRPQLQRQLLLGAARRHYARVRHDLVRKLRHAWDGSDYKITLVAQLLDKARCCCPRSIKHPPSIISETTLTTIIRRGAAALDCGGVVCAAPDYDRVFSGCGDLFSD